MAERSVLVDSSIWIEGLRPQAPPSLRAHLKALIEADRVVISDMVRLEVIAGVRSLKEFRTFRTDFEALRGIAMTPTEWAKAEELSVSLSLRGLRVPPADLLIAAVAITHDLPLWHADRDFERIKETIGGLRTFWYPHHSPAL